MEPPPTDFADPATAVDPVLSAIAAIAALPARPYPAGLDSFADCPEDFSEAQNVNAHYLGRTLERITAAEIAQVPDTPFLRAEAMAYFWPRLLEAIYRHPDSAYAHMMYLCVFSHWGEPREWYDVKPLLTPAEVEAAYAVLGAVRPRVTGKATAGEHVVRKLDKALASRMPAAGGDGGSGSAEGGPDAPAD